MLRANLLSVQLKVTEIVAIFRRVHNRLERRCGAQGKRCRLRARRHAAFVRSSLSAEREGAARGARRRAYKKAAPQRGAERVGRLKQIAADVEKER